MTDWRRFQGRWLDVFKIWEGGLGIWGGIGLGVAVGIWAGVRRGIPLQGGLSAIVPALPLAQAIGRWGNWWNQELFGRPTDLPWALEVSPAKAVAAGYPPGTTFHPTFLYESLWCLFLCGALIWIDRRFRPRGTELLAMYVAGYTFMRFWIERLRVDPASRLWGWRVNEVVSVVVFSIAVHLPDRVVGSNTTWRACGRPPRRRASSRTERRRSGERLTADRIESEEGKHGPESVAEAEPGRLEPELDPERDSTRIRMSSRTRARSRTSTRVRMWSRTRVRSRTSRSTSPRARPGIVTDVEADVEVDESPRSASTTRNVASADQNGDKVRAASVQVAPHDPTRRGWSRLRSTSVGSGRHSSRA